MADQVGVRGVPPEDDVMRVSDFESDVDEPFPVVPDSAAVHELEIVV